MMKNITFIILFFLAQNVFAHAPTISVTSGDQTVDLISSKLEGITLKPLRSLKEEWDEKNFTDFLSVYEIAVNDNATVVGKYKVPTIVKNGNGLRITLYRVVSKDGKQRFMELAYTNYYPAGTPLEIPIVAEKKSECFYIVTAEAVKSEKDIDPNLAYMLSLQKSKRSLEVTDIGTNFTLSDVKLSMKDQEDKFKLTASDAYNRLINPHWIILFYPHYK